jgi:hypothetical protein
MFLIGPVLRIIWASSVSVGIVWVHPTLVLTSGDMGYACLLGSQQPSVSIHYLRWVGLVINWNGSLDSIASHVIYEGLKLRVVPIEVVSDLMPMLKVGWHIMGQHMLYRLSTFSGRHRGQTLDSLIVIVRADVTDLDRTIGNVAVRDPVGFLADHIGSPPTLQRTMKWMV